jgi:hypothetical protein
MSIGAGPARTTTMAYPLDGTPNLRPGSELQPTALARCYDPALGLDGCSARTLPTMGCAAS